VAVTAKIIHLWKKQFKSYHYLYHIIQIKKFHIMDNEIKTNSESSSQKKWETPVIFDLNAENTKGLPAGLIAGDALGYS
jgi:hypothetical protein